jgi:hypothetical protein
LATLTQRRTSNGDAFNAAGGDGGAADGGVAVTLDDVVIEA